MKTLKILLIGLTVLAALAAFCLGGQAVDLSGTWVGKTEVPNQGIDEVTIILKLGEKDYTGTIGDSLGMIVADTEIKDAKFDGTTLTCNFALIDGTVIGLRLKLEGDKLKGQWEHPEGDVGTLEFERKK